MKKDLQILFFLAFITPAFVWTFDDVQEDRKKWEFHFSPVLSKFDIPSYNLPQILYTPLDQETSPIFD